MKCEKLDIWKKAARLSADLNKTFALYKDFGFKDQITRAGFSIASNRAKGIEIDSFKEQIRCLDIAKGSTAEFTIQTYIAMDIGYIEKSIGKEWTEKIDHLKAMITKLQQALRRKQDANE